MGQPQSNIYPSMLKYMRVVEDDLQKYFRGVLDFPLVRMVPEYKRWKVFSLMDGRKQFWLSSYHITFYRKLFNYYSPTYIHKLPRTDTGYADFFVYMTPKWINQRDWCLLLFKHYGDDYWYFANMCVPTWFEYVRPWRDLRSAGLRDGPPRIDSQGNMFYNTYSLPKSDDDINYLSLEFSRANKYVGSYGTNCGINDIDGCRLLNLYEECDQLESKYVKFLS